MPYKTQEVTPTSCADERLLIFLNIVYAWRCGAYFHMLDRQASLNIFETK